MRILMLNNEFPPLGGGTGTVNRELLKRLARARQLEIDLITSSLGSRPEEEEFAGNIRLYKVPVNNRNIHHSSNRELLTYALRALRSALRRHRTRAYDLCLAWSGLPAGVVALALGRLTGLSYLLRVSGPDIPGFERRYRRLYPVITPLIRIVWKRAERVIAKCRSEAEMIRSLDSETRVTLIPNGVDLRAFQPGEPVPDGGALRLLCVARLIERKGQVVLLEAVERLARQGAGVALELVGTGDSLEAYRERAASLGVAGRVWFAGYVPREEIAARYAAAHVFVLPSYNEGMSVATLEAMAAGLPIVTTRTGGTEELVEEGVNGFVFEPGDVPALTSYLGRLAGDRALARRMGKASRIRAEGFSWEAVAQKYLSLFAGVESSG